MPVPVYENKKALKLIGEPISKKLLHLTRPIVEEVLGEGISDIQSTGWDIIENVLAFYADYRMVFGGSVVLAKKTAPIRAIAQIRHKPKNVVEIDITIEDSDGVFSDSVQNAFEALNAKYIQYISRIQNPDTVETIQETTITLDDTAAARLRILNLLNRMYRNPINNKKISPHILGMLTYATSPITVPGIKEIHMVPPNLANISAQDLIEYWDKFSRVTYKAHKNKIFATRLRDCLPGFKFTEYPFNLCIEDDGIQPIVSFKINKNGKTILNVSGVEDLLYMATSQMEALLGFAPNLHESKLPTAINEQALYYPVLWAAISAALAVCSKKEVETIEFSGTMILNIPLYSIRSAMIPADEIKEIFMDVFDKPINEITVKDVYKLTDNQRDVLVDSIAMSLLTPLETNRLAPSVDILSPISGIHALLYGNTNKSVPVYGISSSLTTFAKATTSRNLKTFYDKFIPSASSIFRLRPTLQADNFAILGGLISTRPTVISLL